MATELSPDQLRFKELISTCGMVHEEALHAIGRRTGPAPGYERLSRAEQIREIDRLRAQGLSSLEAHRVVGLHRPRLNAATISEPAPPKKLSPKAQKRAEKRRREFERYYTALVALPTEGLKGSRK